MAVRSRPPGLYCETFFIIIIKNKSKQYILILKIMCTVIYTQLLTMLKKQLNGRNIVFLKIMLELER